MVAIACMKYGDWSIQGYTQVDGNLGGRERKKSGWIHLSAGDDYGRLATGHGNRLTADVWHLPKGKCCRANV